MKDELVSKEISTSSKEEEERETVLLQVDESTKGIMREIEESLSNDIIDEIIENKHMTNQLNKKVDKIYRLQKENSRILKLILKQIGNDSFNK